MKEEASALKSLTLDPVAAKAYLLNVAETIQSVLLPVLTDRAHARAIDCLYTTIQVANALQPRAVEAAADAQSSALSEGRALEAIDADAVRLIDAITRTAVPASRSCDPPAIERYLQAHARGGASLHVVSAKLLPGGRSKQTILVSLENAVDLPEHLVIRQDWAAGMTQTTVSAEFEVLLRLARAGVRVPAPLILEPSAEALGAPFIIVSRLPGKVVGELFTPPSSVQPVRELAEQLGRFHALDVAEFLALPGIVEHSYTVEQLRGDVAKFRAVIDKLCDPVPGPVRLALEWLTANVGRVQGPRTLVHGDIGFHNNLCDGDHLSAILDWELCHAGSPALDLGYLQVAVEKAMPWSEFMALYHAAGGPPIDPFTIDWYSLYSTVWFFHMMVQARAAIVSGVVHDMEYAFVCAHFGPAALAHISRKLGRVLQRYS